MGNAPAVVAGPLILPVGISVAVADRRSVDRFGSDVAAVIVIVACGVAIIARRNSFELVEGIVGIGVGNAVNGRRGNIAVIVIHIRGLQHIASTRRINDRRRNNEIFVVRVQSGRSRMFDNFRILC